jgi:hypothetical protein
VAGERQFVHQHFGTGLMGQQQRQPLDEVRLSALPFSATSRT